ncbi:aminotransferase class V-fold PLP-dependent enzyme [Rhodococcus koreensis]|uniref:aminotransferase class V-fold PLP-dependent enzyme n=1 Tax=Rhodococcus koreensis TaxID=99653 RepID=UPI00366B023D
MTPEQFRGLFPALGQWAWLDTPGAPPGAAPVTEVLRSTLDDWATGLFDWSDWDHAADHARTEFAAYAMVPPSHVSSLGSLSEAFTTVLSGVHQGNIVVAADEFRSVLFPAMARGRADTVNVRVVERTPGRSRTEDLLAAIDRSTALVAASEVITLDGERVDIEQLADAAHAVGAQFFANLTQTMGVLRTDLSNLGADFTAVHGYKWMLCPRGTTWLVGDPAGTWNPEPLAPSWKTTGPPEHYFGGRYQVAQDATRWNTSPAWFSWIGARAALKLLTQLPARDVADHCLHLADRFTAEATDLGFRSRNNGRRSHIVTIDPPEGITLQPASLTAQHVKATLSDGGFRAGFHYFNNIADVDAALQVLRSSITGHEQG